ncbi:MAG: VIT1/CCC1 transporter family protein [Planctomycetaceae bacterium]|nr:VIT1/CCC1 transporter family protein [Planctomycetaceae bacterium]
MTHDAHSQSHLDAEHTPAAVSKRLARSRRHSYLRDFVYGGIDGAVTTFAVVSGVAGAGLSSGVVIVLGFANLIGDGFSMAAGNYLGARADLQLLERARQTEKMHVERFPDKEREEIRQILSAKGFSGDTLQRAVETITSDPELWVNTMLQEEYGLSLSRPSPVTAALVTLAAFVLIGVLPLLASVVDWMGATDSRPFVVSSVLTGLAFFGVGAVKARFVSDRWYRAGLETLLVGGAAALLAYGIGVLLAGVVHTG